ncbi:hydrogenase nickel incorporation protein HypB [Actinospica sp. MGRD01-02]|uniref:Hydrogenase nickel incorporation protein HypB n=1 Tax=Actinospica acidithermotolerans TaxID=2828514 RepID=A0A941EAK5_9ACTN|nr:hydrogenase nickel incorporation protein HypB [Actinospica acidithermotolerans]MBR7827048.1 hydrogenase nickel incorporation protein HypB [Actinospica acidithermotolerans]
MCRTCGCGEDEDVRVYEPAEAGHEHPHPRDHEHGHEHGHEHSHEHPNPASHSAQARTVELDVPVLAKNDELAARNRERLRELNAFAVNLMSSPGSGKTTLLERTIRALDGARPVCVVEGDQETPLDAQRIRATGCRAVQINTGAGCHLDAVMFADALDRLRPPADALVLTENVGNLVCPALFDLGEQARVVIASVTEGVDKPLKYPHMFQSADVLILNKIDLLPYVDFDVEQFAEHARRVNPRVRIMHLSATRGDGLGAWTDWLLGRT